MSKASKPGKNRSWLDTVPAGVLVLLALLIVSADARVMFAVAALLLVMSFVLFSRAQAGRRAALATVIGGAAAIIMALARFLVGP